MVVVVVCTTGRSRQEDDFRSPIDLFRSMRLLALKAGTPIAPGRPSVRRMDRERMAANRWRTYQDEQSIEIMKILAEVMNERSPFPRVRLRTSGFLGENRKPEVDGAEINLI